MSEYNMNAKKVQSCKHNISIVHINIFVYIIRDFVDERYKFAMGVIDYKKKLIEVLKGKSGDFKTCKSFSGSKVHYDREKAFTIYDELIMEVFSDSHSKVDALVKETPHNKDPYLSTASSFLDPAATGKKSFWNTWGKWITIVAAGIFIVALIALLVAKLKNSTKDDSDMAIDDSGSADAATALSGGDGYGSTTYNDYQATSSKELDSGNRKGSI